MNVPSSTYIKEIDTIIYSQIHYDILIHLYQTNKYIHSLSSCLWKFKINELYPNLPIPDYNLSELYFKISKSYVDLNDFAVKIILIKF